MAPADLNRAIQSSVAIAINEYKYVADLELDLAEIPPVTCRLDEIKLHYYWSQPMVNPQTIARAYCSIALWVVGTSRTPSSASRRR